MPLKIVINPNQPTTQAVIIPDATERTVGVVTLETIRSIAGGGALALQRVREISVVSGAQTYDAAYGDFLVLNDGSETSNVRIQLPPASTLAMIAIKNYATVTDLALQPSDGDSVDQDSSEFFNLTTDPALCVTLISDGVSNWAIQSLYIPV